MTYVSKRKPRVKQQEALDLIANQKVFALLMAMRTGKTKVILDDWARGTGNLLVVAPAGCYRTWETAVAEDVAFTPNVYTWNSGNMVTVTERRKLDKFMANNDGRRILLMNVEALSVVTKARTLAEEFLRQGECMMAIDESVCIKSPRAKRTKYINQMLAPLASKRRILSGLVAPNSPLDLYCQYEFLDPKILGFTSYYAFRMRYAVLRKMQFGGRKVDIVVGYRNTEDLQRRIAPYSFRVRLEDCYDLPPSTYTIRDVPLTKEQERIYKELKEYATASLDATTHVTATIVITQILRMHQILCGHTRDESGVWHAIPEHRTKTLLDLLADYDGKSIIWCSYDADVRKVAEALEKEFGLEGWKPGDDYVAVARFWGGNADTREAEEVRFKHDPFCRFMVATAAAGGRGRTWDNADLVVYYSNSYNLDHRSQSEERPKGVGKTQSIAYVDLVAKGTVDEKILKALRNKINMSSAINGDTWREWVI